MATACATAAPDGLLALADDAIGEVGHGLADPLHPHVAVALGSTAKGLRGPMQAALALLRTRHAAAEALRLKLTADGVVVLKSCTAISEATILHSGLSELAVADLETLAMLIGTNGLRKLERLYLEDYMVGSTPLGAEGIQALCDGLDPGSLPKLTYLSLSSNKIGPQGAAALATALAAGALPRLQVLGLDDNSVGDEGIAKLSAPLRKLPSLQLLQLRGNCITASGLASLFSNLDEEDF